MHALGEHVHGQGAGGNAAQRGGQPQLVVIAAAGIEADDEGRAADPVGKMVDVKRQVVAAGFLAGLDHHHAARVRHALFVQREQGRQGAEHGVAVIGAAAAIEFVAFEAGDPRPVSLRPADHFRLLVEVAVEQHRVASLAGNVEGSSGVRPGRRTMSSVAPGNAASFGRAQFSNSVTAASM